MAVGTTGGALLRATAAQVIADVLQGSSLTDALDRREKQVGEIDRAFLQELGYGTCRWYYRLEFLATKLLSKPLKPREQVVKALILVGLYQLLFSRVPAHAAIGETAGAARNLGRPWATGLVNAVLRRFQREGETLLQEAIKVPGARYSQPAWFIEAVEQAWPQQAGALLEGLLERPPFTLRLDLHKTTPAGYAAELARLGVTARPVRGIPSALILDRPLPVAELPGFREGVVSVQDAGAQLAAFFLDPEPGMRVLDACAAPGGKTGHLLERGGKLELVALDADGTRLERVAQNLQRLGRSAHLVVGDAAAPAGEWAQRSYDRILADVPCTATGVMRRHPDIRLLRRPGDVQALMERQRRIVDALWRLLRPGGKLLYATCSVLPQENEEQVGAFLARHEDARVVELPTGRGITTEHGLQLLPIDRETDGFYYSLLEKGAD